MVSSSLLEAAGIYQVRGDGGLYFGGARPDPGWHRHGTFARWLWMVRCARLVRVRLYKQRWLDPDTGETYHDRSPAEAFSVGFCTVVVVLSLWTWLEMPTVRSGLERVIDGPTDVPSPRTVQRWMRRVLPHSLRFQHTLRDAVIARSEPWPLEKHFPGGVPPPRHSQEKRWRDPVRVYLLHTGLAILFGGAKALQTCAATLLAEARGRSKQAPWPI